jgi:hypothetical protein
MKIYYRYKKFLVKLRKNQQKYFHLELTSFGDLDENQKKAIAIAECCIKNNSSNLYFDKSTEQIQIQLKNIFITVNQKNGFFECDIVFLGRDNQTSDKIIFDKGGIKHIYNKFEKEVERRMTKNENVKEIIINNHLDLILNHIECKN